MILDWWGAGLGFFFYSILLYILFSFRTDYSSSLRWPFFCFGSFFFFLLLLGFRGGFGLFIIRTGILLFLHILHKTTLYFTFFFCFTTTTSTFTTNYFIS